MIDPTGGWRKRRLWVLVGGERGCWQNWRRWAACAERIRTWRPAVSRPFVSTRILDVTVELWCRRRARIYGRGNQTVGGGFGLRHRDLGLFWAVAVPPPLSLLSDWRWKLAQPSLLSGSFFLFLSGCSLGAPGSFQYGSVSFG